LRIDYDRVGICAALNTNRGVIPDPLKLVLQSGTIAEAIAAAERKGK
jgi:hypothetical protein